MIQITLAIDDRCPVDRVVASMFTFGIFWDFAIRGFHMVCDTQFEREKFDFDVFFAEHWRKRPLFVRDGAKHLLGHTWADADFDRVRARALADGETVSERAGEVSFIEAASRFDDRLTELADELAGVFGAPRTWFDAIRTYSSSGIGSHFDHSDNFVLQQSGVKEWTLAPPTHIEQAEIAKRMAGVAGVGGHDMPEDDCVHFTVQPGDLLYIPLFWLHSGVSHEASLSLSLVCPAVSLQSAVLPLLARIAKSHGIGYQPVPALHAHLSDEERESAESALQAAARVLLRRLDDDRVLSAVRALQRPEQLPGGGSAA